MPNEYAGIETLARIGAVGDVGPHLHGGARQALMQRRIHGLGRFDQFRAENPPHGADPGGDVSRHAAHPTGRIRCRVNHCATPLFPRQLNHALRLDAKAVAGTVRDITKLRADVVLLAPGALPNDGKVIEDARTYK